MKGKGRVLVVDEDPVVRLAIDRQLDMLGWDAVSVNNGAEALRVVELGVIVQVLLINLRLPDMDGRAVASIVASRMPWVRVAFMADEALREPLEPRHAPFLLKPFSTTLLANALSGAIRLVHPR